MKQINNMTYYYFYIETKDNAKRQCNLYICWTHIGKSNQVISVRRDVSHLSHLTLMCSLNSTHFWPERGFNLPLGKFYLTLILFVNTHVVIRILCFNCFKIIIFSILICYGQCDN